LLKEIDTTIQANKTRAIPQYHFSQDFHPLFTLIFSSQFLQIKIILLHGIAASFHIFQKLTFGFCEHLEHLTVISIL